MVKISKSKNQSRITIPPTIMTLFDLDPDKNYDWISIQGLPALKKRKEDD